MRKNPRWLFATVAASSTALTTCVKAQEIDPRSGLPYQAGFSAGNGAGTMPFAPQGAYGAQAPTPGEIAGPAPEGGGLLYGDGHQYPKFSPRVNIGHFLGQGFGYRSNFTTANVWVPLQIGDPNDLAFADLRGIVDNHSRLGANLGMGFRRLNPNTNRIWGLYGYYDYRDSGVARYSQMSGGIEVLGPRLDWRANFYVPFNDKVIITSDTYDCDHPRADGNFLFLTRRVGKEATYKGADAEVGFPLLAQFIPGGKCHVGGYYYTGKEAKQAYGARLRLEAQVNTWTHIQGVWQSDQVFGTTAFGGVTFTWPGVKRNVVDDQNGMQERLAEPVYRQQNIAVFQSVQTSEEAAADPVTRQAIRITYLDGAAAPGGNGSLLTPYSTLQAAELNSLPGDLIFVKGGVFNGGNGIALKDGQRLIGNGGSPITGPGKAAGPIALAVAQCPGVGVILPGVSANPADRPIIQNVVGNAITLANNNEVGSLQILNTQGNGIFGNGVQGFSIHDVTVSGSTGAGMRVVNAFGTGTVTRSEFNNNGAGGFAAINDNGNSLSLSLVCNHFNNNTGGFLAGNGLAVSALGSSVTAASNANQYNGNQGSGALFTTGPGAAGTAAAGNGSLTVVSTGDQFNQNQNHGANILAPTGTVAASFTGDQFLANSRPTPPPAGNTVPSAGVFANIGGAGTATANITVANSNLSANEGSGFDLRMDGAGSTAALSLTGNTITQNRGNGIFIRTLNGATTATIAGNTITGNALNGIAFQGFGNATGSMAIRNNTIVGNGTGPATVVDPLTGQAALNGIFLSLFSNSGNAYAITIDGNTITDNGLTTGATSTGSGVFVLMSTQAPAGVVPTASVTVTNNQILRNQSDGIQFFDGGGTVAYQLTANVNNNAINNNGRHGVNFSTRQFAVMTLLVDENTINANGGSGVHGVVDSLGVAEASGIALRVQRNIIDGNGALGGNDPGGLPATAGVHLDISSVPTLAFGGVAQPAGVNLVNINDNVRIANNQVGIEINTGFNSSADVIAGARTAISITNHRNATDEEARIFGNQSGGIVILHGLIGDGRPPVRTANGTVDVRIDRNVIDATPLGNAPGSGTEAIVLGVFGGLDPVNTGTSMEAVVTRNILRGNGYTPTLAPLLVPFGVSAAATQNVRFLAVSGIFGNQDGGFMRLRLEQANVNDLQYNLVLMPPVTVPQSPVFNQFDVASTASTNFGRANPGLVSFFGPASGVYGFSPVGGPGNDFTNLGQPNTVGLINVVAPLTIAPPTFPPPP